MKMIVGEQTLLKESLLKLLALIEEQATMLEKADIPQALLRIGSNAEFDWPILILDPAKDGWWPLMALTHDCPDLPIIALANSDNVKDLQRAMAASAQKSASTAFAPHSAESARCGLSTDGFHRPSTDSTGSAATQRGSAITRPTEPRPRGSGKADKPRLTPRQSDVAKLLMQGKSNKEIGRSLNIAEGTVKQHCTEIYRKLGAANRTQAAIAAERYFSDSSMDDDQHIGNVPGPAPGCTDNSKRRLG